MRKFSISSANLRKSKTHKSGWYKEEKKDAKAEASTFSVSAAILRTRKLT
jgi:hypothetical protein